MTQVGDLDHDTSYSYISYGTGSVTSGNTSTSEENIYIDVRAGSESGSSVARYTVKVNPDDVSDDDYKASIAKSIADAVNGKK